MKKDESLGAGRLIDTTGTCAYCQSVRIIKVDKDATEKEKNDIATLECDCEQAQRAAKAQTSVRMIREKIKDRYQDLPEKLQKALLNAVEPVAEGYAEVITIRQSDSVTFKIHMKKGSVNLKRVVKNEETIDA